MNLEYFYRLVKSLIELVRTYKYCISVMDPEGWQKEYLRTLCKSIVNLQRCILQVDTYKPFLRYSHVDFYKLAMAALRYDAFAAFRKLVAQHEDILNDTFLFVE